MRIKTGLTAIFLSLATPLVCTKPIKTQIVKTPAEYFEHSPKLRELVADTFSIRNDDKTKIIEYNKLLKKYKKQTGNYIIVDKKQCEASIYNSDGELILKEEVGLGKHKGDKRAGGYRKKHFVQSYTTAPGEYYINKEGSIKGTRNERLYGKRLFTLVGEHTKQESKKSQTLALHQIPNSRRQERTKAFNNNTLEDNRMSYGCVNFLDDAFDRMRKNIRGIKTKVYILPEEEGNSLHLEKQKDGSYKFFQTKYRYESQETEEIKK